eukprot:2283594-Amphidinium_carterae.1
MHILCGERGLACDFCTGPDNSRRKARCRPCSTTLTGCDDDVEQLDPWLFSWAGRQAEATAKFVTTTCDSALLMEGGCSTPRFDHTLGLQSACKSIQGPNP